MLNYDSWKLDTPDNHVIEITECAYCGGMIYRGEDYQRNVHNLYHSECMKEEIEHEEMDF